MRPKRFNNWGMSTVRFSFVSATSASVCLKVGFLSTPSSQSTSGCQLPGAHEITEWMNDFSILGGLLKTIPSLGPGEFLLGIIKVSLQPKSPTGSLFPHKSSQFGWALAVRDPSTETEMHLGFTWTDGFHDGLSIHGQQVKTGIRLSPYRLRQPTMLVLNCGARLRLLVGNHLPLFWWLRDLAGTRLMPSESILWISKPDSANQS